MVCCYYFDEQGILAFQCVHVCIQSDAVAQGSLHAEVGERLTANSTASMSQVSLRAGQSVVLLPFQLQSRSHGVLLAFTTVEVCEVVPVVQHLHLVHESHHCMTFVCILLPCSILS